MNIFYRRLLEEQHLTHCGEIDALRKSSGEELRRREEEGLRMLQHERKRCNNLQIPISSPVPSVVHGPAIHPEEVEALQRELSLLRFENTSLRSQMEEHRGGEERINQLSRELCLKERLLREAHTQGEQSYQSIAELNRREAAHRTRTDEQQRQIMVLQNHNNELLSQNNLLLKEKSHHYHTSNYSKPALQEYDDHLSVGATERAAFEVKQNARYSAYQEEVNDLRNRLQRTYQLLKKEKEKGEQLKLSQEQQSPESKELFNSRLKLAINKLQQIQKTRLRYWIFNIWRFKIQSVRKLRPNKEPIAMTHMKPLSDKGNEALDAFRDLRNMLLAQFCRLFCLAADGTIKKKWTSFQLFCGEFEILMHKNNFSEPFALFFFRLKKSLKSYLPHLKNITRSLENKREKENSSSSVLCELETVCTGSAEEWLLSQIKKAKKERKNKSISGEFVTFLYQLLAIWHRANNPLRCDANYNLSADFIEILGTKIVSAGMKYITLQAPKKHSAKIHGRS